MKKWAGALLITKVGKVILQIRDINPKIINSGMITLFGGSVEGPESTEECFKREIHEELGLDISDYRFFGLYKKRQATHSEDCDCYVYLVPGINIDTIKVGEGRGYKLISTKDNYLTSEYSPITQIILNDYFKN